MAQNILYVYCIVRQLPGADIVARYPDLVFIEAGSAFVAAKYVPPLEYSDASMKLKLADEEWLDRNAREHLSVNVMIMAQQTIIPFNFGTIFKTRESLSGFLGDYGQKLGESFDALEDREEWAVKAYCNESFLLKNLHLQSPAIAAIEQEIQEASPGKAYLLKKKKEAMSASALEGVHQGHAKAVWGELAALSKEHVLNRLIPEDVSGVEGRMIVNGVFLIANTDVGAFIRTTEDLGERYRDAGVFLDVTGPWPPYDFVDIPY